MARGCLMLKMWDVKLNEFGADNSRCCREIHGVGISGVEVSRFKISIHRDNMKLTMIRNETHVT